MLVKWKDPNKESSVCHPLFAATRKTDLINVVNALRWLFEPNQDL